jgi:hypothetical protein
VTTLVTTDQAQLRLKLDVAEGDADLELMIEGASAAILAYLKLPDGFDDAVPPEVQNATLALVGIMYRDPDGTEMQNWQQGYLPWAVTALIYHLRSLTVA